MLLFVFWGCSAEDESDYINPTTVVDTNVSADSTVLSIVTYGDTVTTGDTLRFSTVDSLEANIHIYGAYNVSLITVYSKGNLASDEFILVDFISQDDFNVDSLNFMQHFPFGIVKPTFKTIAISVQINDGTKQLSLEDTFYVYIGMPAVLNVSNTGLGNIEYNQDINYYVGDTVEFVAIANADSNYVFVKWEGIVSDSLSLLDTVAIVLADTLNITALFRKTVVIDLSENNIGSVVYNQDTTYYVGDTVEFTAIPLDSSKIFLKWIGIDDSLSNPLYFVLTDSLSLKAEFATVCTLIVINDGNGTTNPSNEIVVFADIDATIIAIPNRNYRFVSWTSVNENSTLSDLNSDTTLVQIASGVDTLLATFEIVDTIAPDAPTVAVVSITNNLKPEWTWTSAGDGSGIFRYSFNVDSIVVAEEIEALSFVPTTDLDSGYYTLYIQEKDSVDNWSNIDSATVYIDLSAPNVPMVNLLGGSPTNNTTPTWTWTSGGNGAGLYQYSIDDSVLVDTLLGVVDTFYTSAVKLTEGEYVLYVWEKDSVGNWSEFTSSKVIIDLSAPGVPSLVTTENELTKNNILTWTWSSGGNGSGLFQFSLDDSVINNSFEGVLDTVFTSTQLVDGIHTLYVWEKNATGNWSLPASLSIRVDRTAPTAPILTLVDSAFTNNQTPTWTWVSGGGGMGLYQFKLDNQILDTTLIGETTTSYTAPTNLFAGLHTLYIWEKDSAGNWSDRTVSTVTIDTTAPNPPIVSSTSDSISNNQQPTWTWASGGNGVGLYQYKINDSTVSIQTSGISQTSYTPGSPLANGVQTLYVWEKDGVGNWSSFGYFSIRIDTSSKAAPKFDSTANFTNNLKPTWSWTSGDGIGTYRYSFNSNTLSSASETTDSSYTPSSDLDTGLYVMYLQEKDNAGNWSNVAKDSIYIDVLPPSAPSFTNIDSATTNRTIQWDWASSNDGMGVFQFNLDNNSFSSGNSTTTLTQVNYSNLSFGKHILYIREIDEAGNWSEYDSCIIEIMLDLKISDNGYGAVTQGSALEVSVNTAITLDAVADNGYAFSHWTRSNTDVVIADSVNASTTFTLFDSASVEAVFKVITFDKVSIIASRQDGAGIIQTDDGGFLIAGNTDSKGAGGSDIWVVKIDENGDSLWDNTIGSVNDERSVSLIRGSNNDGYLIGAQWDGEVSLVKLFENGSLDWRFNYGTGTLASVIKTNDNGYLMLSTKNSRISLEKVNQYGASQWEANSSTFLIDTNHVVVAMSVLQLSDSTIYVLIRNYITSENLLLQITPQGVYIKTNILSYISSASSSMIESADGNIIIASAKANSEVFLKLAPSGMMLINEGNTVYSESASGPRSMCLVDGGYLMTGSRGRGDDYGAFIKKVDLNGVVIWNKNYGPDFTSFNSVYPNNVGGFVFTGTVTDPNTGIGDLWIVKTDADGNVQ